MSSPSSAASAVEAPADAELISAVRGGDTEAYGELFARHVGAANRLARQLVAPGDADDLVAEAFAKVLGVLQRGGGPDVAFRAYLLTSVRRLHVDRLRSTAKVRPTDDLTPFETGVPFEDTAVAAFENQAAAKAFASLPERWQLVLWHTEVEGQKPAEVAPLLGMSANSVSALAYRAREGLRQAFLTMHAQELEDDACRWTHDQLGGYIRHGLSRRDTAKVEKHLEDCRSCMAVYLELVEVNSDLAGLLAPLLLGGAGAAYAATAGGVAVKGGVLALATRVKDWAATNTVSAAVVGVAATAAVAAGVVGLVNIGDTEPVAARDDVATSAPADASTPDSTPSAPGDSPGDDPRAPRPGTDPGDRPTSPEPTSAAPTSPTPSDSPTSPQPTSPTSQPTSQPTTQPTTQPTSQPPTSSTTDVPTTTTPPTEPTGDVRISVSANPQGSGRHLVSATVAGMPAGQPATLYLSTSGLTPGFGMPSGCQAVGAGAECTFTADRTITFDVSVLAGTGVMTFVVIADRPAEDPDSLNNFATISLSQ